MTPPTCTSSATLATPTIVYSNDLQGIKAPNFNRDAPDLTRHFNTFKRYCELILSTPTYASKPGKETVNFMLLWMGPQAVEIFDNWSHLTVAQKETPSDVWDAFQSYFEPKSNFRLARFQLRDINQSASETIDNYLVRLKVQAQKCNFGTPEQIDDNILDQLIKGSAHPAVRKKILECDPKTLNLDKAVDIARTFEATQSQLLQFNRPTESSVDFVRNPRNQNRPKYSDSQSFKGKNCNFCGGEIHPRPQCPARESICNKCKKRGHWGKVCLSSNSRYRSQSRNRSHSQSLNGQDKTQKQNQNFKKNDNKRSAKKFNEITNRPSENPQMYQDSQMYQNFENMTFDSVSLYQDSVNSSPSAQQRRKAAHAVLQIEPYDGCFTNLKGKIDTGSEGNLLPFRTFSNIYPQYVKDGKPTITNSSEEKLIAYGGTTIPHLGTITIPCKYMNSEWQDVKFFISQAQGPVILGSDLCEDLGIVTINRPENEVYNVSHSTVASFQDIQSMYPDRFQGIGKFPIKHRLILEENATPVIHPPRRAPIQLREKIKAELDHMMSLEVIRPVN